MIWVVIHRGADGNKQSNSLSCALEEALLLHWLFKCTHSVCVCVHIHFVCYCVSDLILHIHNNLLLLMTPCAVLVIPAK